MSYVRPNISATSTVGPAMSVAVPRELLAWLFRRSLDARLAAGESQEGSRLLAVRATQLVSVRCRRRLAAHWDALAVQARRPFTRSATDVPEQIQQVADLLCSHQLVLARGVALALTMRSLATDAVRRSDTGGDDLVGAIARAAFVALTVPGDELAERRLEPERATATGVSIVAASLIPS